MADIAKGLSDLGLMSDTQSSAIDNGPTLDDLLFNSDSIVDNTRKIAQIEEAQAAGPQSGFMDQLKNPRVLIPLLAALAGGIATKNPGLAAGGALGALQGADQNAQTEGDEYMKALEKSKKEAQDELEKTRNRLATLFNTNPEALVAADGSPLSPQLVGWYLTGTPVGLDTSARRNAEQRGTRWTKKMDLLLDGVKTAATLDDAKSLVTQSLVHLGDTSPEPATVETLARAAFEDPSKFDYTFAARLLDLGPNAGAILYGAENGLPLSHPDVLRLVKLYPKDAGGDSKETVPDRQLKLMDRVTEWTLDSRNSQLVSDIRSKAPTTKDAAVALAEAALSATPNEATMLTNFLKSNDYLPELLESFGRQVAGEKTVDQMRTYGDFGTLMNETPEQASRRRMTNATRDVQEGQKAVGKQIINQVVATRDAGAQKLAAETGLGQEAVYDLINQVYARAIEATPVDKQGKRNMATFQKNFQAELKKEIEANK